MVKLIVGKKGTGKTKMLVDLVHQAADASKGNVVCIEKGNSLTYDIRPQVRLVRADEFKIHDYAAMNGFVSLGPALLNDHAVNYRAMARQLPDGMLLVESDRAASGPGAAAPRVGEVAAFLARLRGVPADALAATLEANADRFAGRP